MIEFEEYKLKLNDLKPKLEALAASLNLDRVRNELERFHAMQEAPGFWDDPDRSQKIVVQTKLLEAKLEKYHAMTAQMEDLLTICEMALEENDDSMLPELQEGFEELSQRMEEARLATMRSCPSTPEPVARRPRTGARCSTGCTPAGQNATASRIKFWIIWRAMRRD